MKTVKGNPFIGTEKLYVYRVDTDDSTGYDGDVDTMIKLEGSMVSSNFDLSASTTSFFADNAAQISDTTMTPSASIGYAGDSPELDELLYGKKNDGGAMLDNLGSAPECGCFYVMNQANNGWVVRQICRFTAAKDSVDISTKGESVSFTNPTATLTPLVSNYFNTYVRDFYSTDKLLAGKTAQDVIDALVADPGHVFTNDEEI